jgi:hypothetical protein
LNYPTETRTNQESCGSTVSQNVSQRGPRQISNLANTFRGTMWISKLGTYYLVYSLSSRRLKT